MSHFTRIRTRLEDREALIQALSDLGYPIEEGPATGYSGATAPAEVRIPRQDGYSIGFSRTTQGTFDVVGDFQMMRDPVDPARLVQDVTRRYAYHVTRRQLEQQGFALVEEDVSQDGRVHMLLRRMG